MDIGYLLSFLAGMCIAILDVVVCDIIFHKFFKRKRNKVHFYVAKDEDGELWLYLGKPIRKEEDKMFNTKIGSEFICSTKRFKEFGLNADDYKDLRWEGEPVEVFLNLED